MFFPELMIPGTLTIVDYKIIVHIFIFTQPTK